MKFNIGDRIKIIRCDIYFGNHEGCEGTVVGYRPYPFWKRIGVNEPTHYVVKFDCYKINHIYMSGVVDDNCEKVEV